MDRDRLAQAADDGGCFRAAICSGDLTAVQQLLWAQADPSSISDAETGDSPLHLIVADPRDCRRADLLTALCRASADVDVLNLGGCAPLRAAVSCGNLRCVAVLAGAQACASAAALYDASDLGLLEALNQLTATVAPSLLQVPLSNGCATPLHAAAMRGYDAVARALIDTLSADVNLLDSEGSTPLFLASKFGYEAVVRTLLAAYADVNRKGRSGTTPLYMACQNGHAGAAEALIAGGADANLRNHLGPGPLHVAAQEGHGSIVEALLTLGGADANLPGKDGRPAITLAAQKGHREVVERLLAAGADVNLQDGCSLTPLVAAVFIGRLDIVRILVNRGASINLASQTDLAAVHLLELGGCTDLAAVLVSDALNRMPSNQLAPLPTALAPNLLDFARVFLANAAVQNPPVPSESPPEDGQLSSDLHSALSLAGFTRARAALQGSVADVLQDILRRRCRNDGLCVVGSYSEGWGNSVFRLNGRTDVESDIDITQLLGGRLFHIKDMCRCPGVASDQQDEYQNGHIMRPGWASTPARAESGTALRPAIDRVDACRLCCYPPIGPLQPERVSESDIPPSVLQSLEEELIISPCHVVFAAPNREAGKQLRVSTTFLEKRLLRSLSTLQGQLFITLKYLVKKVINLKVQGIKPYHAKCLTFYMLERTAPAMWRSEFLVQHIRTALQDLLAGVQSLPSRSDERVMDHFFLSDAAIYLRGNQRSEAANISQVLRDTIGNLTALLRQFITELGNKKLDSGGRFYFHPFLVMPVLDAHPPSQSPSLQYHEIYDVVRDALLQLADNGCYGDLLDRLAESVARLPDCARTAQGCLQAMVCLKSGRGDAAAEIVADVTLGRVSRGIDSPPDAEADATPEFVLRHLTDSDSAWRFCFRMRERPSLSFLPGGLADCFPGVLENYDDCIYVNFDALLDCLRFELLPVDSEAAWELFEGVTTRIDSDAQDMLMALRYCPDYAWRVQLVQKFNLLGSRDQPTRNMAHQISQDFNAQQLANMQNLAANSAEMVADLQRDLSAMRQQQNL